MGLISRILGGRPMEKLEPAFEDVITGGTIYYFRDTKEGRYWMARYRWSPFRIEVTDTMAEVLDERHGGGS